MKRRFRNIPILFLIGVVVAAIAWQALFHGPCDTKDLRYQAWKLGLYPMNIDLAIETMVPDAHRDSLVIGKTKTQIERRFGFVSPLKSNSYIQHYCYENSWMEGKQAFLLRNSNWIVLMQNGVAVNLVLAKGC